MADPRGTQDFAGASRTLQAEPSDPKSRMRPGQWIKGPESDIPLGWQPIMVGDGQWQAWPMPPASYDPECRRKILAQVDAAYKRCLPTEEHPTRKPVSMLVNPMWHRLFPATRYWGEPPVEVMLADQPDQIPQDAPRFKFVAVEPQSVDAPLDPSQVEIRMAPRPDERWDSPPPAQPYMTTAAAAQQRDQAPVQDTQFTAPPPPGYVQPYARTVAEAPNQDPMQFTAPPPAGAEQSVTPPAPPLQYTAPPAEQTQPPQVTAPPAMPTLEELQAQHAARLDVMPQPTLEAPPPPTLDIPPVEMPSPSAQEALAQPLAAPPAELAPAPPPTPPPAELVQTPQQGIQGLAPTSPTVALPDGEVRVAPPPPPIQTEGDNSARVVPDQ